MESGGRLCIRIYPSNVLLQEIDYVNTTILGINEHDVYNLGMCQMRLSLPLHMVPLGCVHYLTILFSMLHSVTIRFVIHLELKS